MRLVFSTKADILEVKLDNFTGPGLTCRKHRVRHDHMKKKKVSATLASEAYDILRRRILLGQVGLGQAISRRQVATELGMSLLPVSEAFLRLEFEGLLESRPRAGTRVRIPVREDVEGHYVVREGLEVQAARLFAEKATSEERNELIKMAARVDVMSEEPEADRAVYLALHERFHSWIAECGHCAALSEAIEKTCARSIAWVCIGQNFSNAHVPHRHQELAEALCQQDVSVAAEAMRKHLEWRRDWVLEQLEPFFNKNKLRAVEKYERSSKKRSTNDTIAPLDPQAFRRTVAV